MAAAACMRTKRMLAHWAPLGLSVGLGWLVCAADAGAQVYKWTDANGVASFSDQPPPAGVRLVERKSPGSSGAARAELPYALAEAAKTHPVLLYTTTPCEACDQGRALLRQRGIPFAEKTVQSNADQKKLKDAGSNGQLPLLQVGSSRRIGFEASAWNAALTDAAYPLQGILPANWQHPAAVAAAPILPPLPSPPPPPPHVVQQEPTTPTAPVHRLKLPSDAPPGFRF